MPLRAAPSCLAHSSLLSSSTCFSRINVLTLCSSSSASAAISLFRVFNFFIVSFEPTRSSYNESSSSFKDFIFKRVFLLSGLSPCGICSSLASLEANLSLSSLAVSRSDLSWFTSFESKSVLITNAESLAPGPASIISSAYRCWELSSQTTARNSALSPWPPFRGPSSFAAIISNRANLYPPNLVQQL